VNNIALDNNIGRCIMADAKYKHVTDENGKDYYCPTDEKPKEETPEDLGECVDGDATRRYSGDIDVES